MGKRSHRYDSDDSPSTDPPSDDSPPSTDSDDSFDDKHSRHSSSSKRHGGHGHAKRRAAAHSDDSDADGSSDSEESEDRHRGRGRRHGGGGRRHKDDSSDEEALIAAHKRRRKRHRRAAAGAPPPSGGGDNNALFIGAGILLLLLALGGGAWWWYNRDSASASSGSSSTGGSSTGSTGGTGSGAGSSGGAGGAGGAAGSSAGGTGAAGGGASASKASSAGASGSSAGGGSKTTSGGASGTAGAGGASSTSTPSGGGGGGGKVAAFWENWTGLSVADTKFDGYDYCFWFCAVPGTAAEKGKLTMGEATEGIAKEWVAAAQAAGCKAMLSVGGWSGSNTFSGLVASDTSRADFVDTLNTAMTDYGFDGIDSDWEYPGKAGATNDFDVANDLNNYLDFFKTLREKIGSDKLISADTSSGPWVGADGQPSSDLSAFGDVLDFITIMTYDAVTYSSKTTGPNFAYDSSCGPSTQQFNVPASVKSWTDAKFPADKIMLGLAAYGYAWKVADYKDGGGVDGATSSIYQTASEVLTAADGSKPYDKILSDFKSDMDYTFDDCSKSPFLYSSSSQLFITYDDPDSFAVKGAYASENGLMGCSLYAAMTQNVDGTLRDAAKKVC
ncbi:Chalcone--flavanone isomerase 1 [Rhodotorula kratochvilovae]